MERSGSNGALVQRDDGGGYIAGGDILFPLSWDTEEKRKAAVLKSYKEMKD